jgi:hypothetical protein
LISESVEPRRTYRHDERLIDVKELVRVQEDVAEIDQPNAFGGIRSREPIVDTNSPNKSGRLLDLRRLGRPA